MSGRPAIVVLGMMTKMPVAGIVWLTVPYLVGLERLGYDVYYVEAHARTPSMLMEGADDDGSARAASFIQNVMDRFDLDGRWAFHALHHDGRLYGMSEVHLRELYRSAELIVNLHGGTEPRPEHVETGRLVLVETDPVQLEIELYEGDPRARDFVAAHCALFTWGENYGNPDCQLPLPAGFEFRPTRMPVLLDEWQQSPSAPRKTFTTIGNWEQSWREVVLSGEIYHWSKHYEFLKFLDLPQRSGRSFELALENCGDQARALLRDRGWRVRPALDISQDVDAYRDYIRGSWGEFTVAKDQNVRLRSGWFSDRSASYLAAGRPVITQDTGFSSVLPTGEGLFGFSTMDDVLAAVEEVDENYDRHARAAAEIAREYFDCERVLRRMLTDLGLPAYPPGLSLAPVSRAPTTLAEATVEIVARTPLLSRARRAAQAPEPEVTVIVVTMDGLVFTRLCLESVLGDPGAPALELIVVDNGSVDDTRAYLRRLADLDPRVRVVENDRNVGFAAAVNQGIELGRGRCFVLLNNDTFPPPGALSRLVDHLRDEQVGLVGPVSNRAASEAEINRDYETIGQLLESAERRAGAKRGTLLDVSALTMFCTAFRRDLYEEIGPLDERFGIGLFEDDDYSLRVRRAHYRVACAEDVLVHHFGEASFGRLIQTGNYTRLLTANRRLYEEKWGKPWHDRGRRRSDDYAQLVRRVRDIVRETVPTGSRVLVVSRGDDDLLELGMRRAGHFPQLPGGVYAGHYPADAAEAIAQLEALEADYLVLPSTSLWWLEHYDGLRRHLQDQCVRAEAACSIFSLSGTA